MSENRLTAFKNKGKNSEEMRRRRIKLTVEIRKACKDDQLLKRRNISVLNEVTSSSPVTMNTEAFIRGIMSTDEQMQLMATVGARKILCRSRNPPIDIIIECGAVTRFVQFLTRSHNPALQLEACWALTNIASGTAEHTEAVVGAGALPKLQSLLVSPRADLAEQAVWALGNIAGDCAAMRDVVLNNGAILSRLLQLVQLGTPISLLRTTVWTLSNLCGNKNPAPNFDLVRPALPVLATLLHHKDNAVVADACWALAFISDGASDKIQAVLDTGLIGRLVELLDSDEVTVLSAALGAVGNILTGDDTQTDFVINAGVLRYVARLLQHPHLHIVKEAAWAASNITAGSIAQIQRVIDADVMGPLLNVLQRGVCKSQKEAAWAVVNYTNGATVMQLVHLVKLGALRPMCNLLKSHNSSTVIGLLDGLSNILNAAHKLGEKDVAVVIEECGGLDTLEALQQHYNGQISEKASLLIGQYFSKVEKDENTPTDGQIQCNPLTNDIPDGRFSF